MKKLIFVTQSYEPSSGVMGFVPTWVEEAQKNFSQVTVFCLRTEKKFKNVYSFQQKNDLFTFLKLNYLLFKHRKNCDVIFCHYSAKFSLALYPLVKILRKKMFQWWAHPHSPWELKVIGPHLRQIFTPSHDSFPLQLPNVKIMGHGIAARFFSHKNALTVSAEAPILLVSIGRICSIKNYSPLIKAMAQIKRDSSCVLSAHLYGPLLLEADHQYKKDLTQEARNLSVEEQIIFHAELPSAQVLEQLLQTHFFINLQRSGGIGKAILEALALGVPTFFCTSAFDHEIDEDLVQKFKFDDLNPEDLAKKILAYVKLPQEEQLQIKERLREYVRDRHQLSRLWPRLAMEMN